MGAVPDFDPFSSIAMCDTCLVVLTCLKIFLCETGRLSSFHASLFFAVSLKQIVWAGGFGSVLQIFTALVPEAHCSLLAPGTLLEDHSIINAICTKNLNLLASVHAKIGLLNLLIFIAASPIFIPFVLLMFALVLFHLDILTS